MKKFWSISCLMIMLPISVLAQVIDDEGINTWIIGNGIKEKIMETIPEPPNKEFKSAAPKIEHESQPEITCPQPTTKLQVIYKNNYFVYTNEDDFSTTLKKSTNPNFAQYFKKDSFLDFFLKIAFFVSILSDDIIS